MSTPLPTLLDRWDPNTKFELIELLRPEFSSAMAYRGQARRYVFDADASRRVGEMLCNDLPLIIDNIEFARPTFPTMYVEFDFDALWHAWHPSRAKTPVADAELGFLIHKDLVVPLVTADDFPSPVVPLVGHRVNRPQSPQLRRDLAVDDEQFEILRVSFVFGGYREVDKHGGGIHNVYLPKMGNLGEWEARQVAAHFDIRPAYDLSSISEQRRASSLRENIFRGGGDPVILTAALLLLSQPRHVVEVQEQAGWRGIYRGKLRWVKEHHRVVVHLDPSEEIRRRARMHTDRASPLLHDVEGHWKNFNRPDEPCSHEWEPLGQERTVNGDYRRYFCPNCLQRRVWTEAYLRGDATRGVATHDYEVRR